MTTRREWMKRSTMLGAGWALASAVPGTAGLRGQASAPRSDGAQSSAKDTLKAHASAKGLLVGAAASAGLLREDAGFRRLLAEQCNIVVAENCMKWGGLRPTAESYSFGDADALVAFAEEHGMKVRGHNLVWHEALPKWFEGTVTKDNAESFLVDHIQTVAGRYRGKIHSWDVVNEAVWVKDGRADGLRESDSPWFQLLGPGYIDLAFRTARAADPKALLTYNEYGIESTNGQDPAKRAATLALLRRMKADHVPVDALGVQSHIRAGEEQNYRQGLQELKEGAKALGLEVFITELDVNDDGVAAEEVAERDQSVAATYRDYLTTALDGPEVKAVLTWGASNRSTWLNYGTKARKIHPERLERPLPFDENDAPTAAFFAMRDCIDRAKKR